MEILSTTTHTGEYWIVLTLAILMLVLSIALTSGMLWTIIHDKEYSAIWGFLTCLCIALLLGLLSFVVIDSGPRVSHKVTITDFNEVYNQGYEIIGQDGEIYTIQLKEGE